MNAGSKGDVEKSKDGERNRSAGDQIEQRECDASKPQQPEGRQKGTEGCSQQGHNDHPDKCAWPMCDEQAYNCNKRHKDRRKQGQDNRMLEVTTHGAQGERINVES